VNVKQIWIVLLSLALGCADDSDSGKMANAENNNSQNTSNNAPNNSNENNQALNNDEHNNPLNNGTVHEVEVPTHPRIFVDGLDFGEVAAGSSKTLPLEISNGGTELTISAIEVDGTDFTLEDVEFPLVIGPRQMIEVDVHLTPSVSTERVGVIRVHSDDPDSPIHEADVVSNMLCGMLSEVTTILEDTAVGESHTRTVSLTNCSEIVEIHVTAFETSPNGNPNFSSDFTFSEVEAPFVLLPGEVSSFDVVFEPLIPGQHAAQFSYVTTGTLGVNRSQFSGRIVATEVSE